jgi:hypothetical protein
LCYNILSFYEAVSNAPVTYLSLITRYSEPNIFAFFLLAQQILAQLRQQPRLGQPGKNRGQKQEQKQQRQLSRRLIAIYQKGVAIIVGLNSGLKPTVKQISSFLDTPYQKDIFRTSRYTRHHVAL